MSAQSLEALGLANQVVTLRKRQRDELRGKPEREIMRTLIDPPEELASYTLGKLFSSSRDRNSGGAIRGLGCSRLHKALARLPGEYPLGRQNWHTELRLRELTVTERRRLVRALFASVSRGVRS